MNKKPNKCPFCNGTGVVERAKDYDPQLDLCNQCEGFGYLPLKSCKKCGQTIKFEEEYCDYDKWQVYLREKKQPS